jgi:basic amino acid/polyamine antiporter, APA family
MALLCMISIATLFAFAVVSLGTLKLADCRCPIAVAVPRSCGRIVAPLGAATSIFLMFGLPIDSWMRPAVWLAIGLLISFAYGAKHSRVAHALRGSSRVNPVAHSNRHRPATSRQ